MCVMNIYLIKVYWDWNILVFKPGTPVQGAPGLFLPKLLITSGVI